MRNISLFITIVIMEIVFITTCLAEGYTEISGNLGGGWEVIVSTEPPIAVWVWKRTKNGGITDAKEYTDEGCLMTFDYSKPGADTRTLACPSNGSTPLAGTKYFGRRHHGNCENGDPEFLFKCIEGCGPKSKAPKKMRQEHWEC